MDISTENPFVSYHELEGEHRLIICVPHPKEGIDLTKIKNKIEDVFGSKFKGFKSICKELDKSILNIQNSIKTKHYVSKRSLKAVINSSIIEINLFFFPWVIHLSYDKNQDFEKQAKNIYLLFDQLNTIGKKVQKNSTFKEVIHNATKPDLILIDSKLLQLKKLIQNYLSKFNLQIVCSDKTIGIPVDELNRIEANPLKIYQQIPHPPNKATLDLIDICLSKIIEIKSKTFVSQNTIFLVKSSLNLVLDVKNKHFYRKSSVKNINCDRTFFEKYAQKYAIDDYKIYELLRELFLSELNTNHLKLEDVDLATLLESRIQNGLRGNYSNLIIGDEYYKNFRTVNTNNEEVVISKDESIYKWSILTTENASSKAQHKQFPDFLIPLSKNQNSHTVLDSKLKKLDGAPYAEDIRQITIYHQLFNTENTVHSKESFLIYPERFTVNISSMSFQQLRLSNSPIFLQLSKIKQVYRDSITNHRINCLNINLLNL